jgi:hypothetical protein
VNAFEEQMHRACFGAGTFALLLDDGAQHVGIAALETGKLKSAVVRALRQAGATALRDVRSEARKRITARKRIKAKYTS